ncbi:MAG TPA: response regulator, partial [Spirochaetia bacterium]|nr:response regulator [Spirochaetia bacterium]
MTLLIVDDEKTICDGLRALVERLDLPRIDKIRTAYRSDDAIQIAQEEHPQILITDVRMPGRTGLELLAELRRRQPGIRGIVVTGHDDFELVRQALRLETIDYLLKPATRDELRNALERAIAEIENDSSTEVLQIDERMHYFDSLVDVSWSWFAEGAHLTAETIHYLEQTLQDRIGFDIFGFFAFEHETARALESARPIMEDVARETRGILWRLRDESKAVLAVVASPSSATAKLVAERVSACVSDHAGLHVSLTGVRKGLGSLPSLYAELTLARASKLADESCIHSVDESAAPQSYESWVQNEALRMVVSVVEDDPADESERAHAAIANLRAAASIPVRLLALWEELERNARLITGRASLRFPPIAG